MNNLVFTIVAFSSLSAFSSGVKKYEECNIKDYKTISKFSYKTGKILTVGITEESLNNGEQIVHKALVDSTEASSRSRERLEYKLKKLEIFADKNCQHVDDRTASI
jgi:ribosomal protein S18